VVATDELQGISMTVDEPEIRLVGELDDDMVEQLDACIDQLLTDVPASLVVDATGLLFLGSAGVTSLLRARSQLDHLVIRGCSTRIRRTFEMANLERFFMFED
jgi:anti-anti-sigma factor